MNFTEPARNRAARPALLNSAAFVSGWSRASASTASARRRGINSGIRLNSCFRPALAAAVSAIGVKPAGYVKSHLVKVGDVVGL